MRIGVNALYLIPGGVGGTEIYLRSLLAALASIDTSNEYLVFTNGETGTDLISGAANFRCLAQPVDGTNRPARILYEQVELPLQAKMDVLFNPGFTAPIFPPCPQVTVFHDLQHKRHPEFFRWFDLPAWQFLLWASVRRSAKLIAVSEATRQDLLRYYGASSTVVPHGVDERFFQLPRRPEPLLLCVSTLHPHKNHERLLRVFARLRESNPGLTLVLTGVRGFHTAAVEEMIRELRLEEAVQVLGWIPREDLYEWFAKAAAFVYPSTFEGFGMPVLEALAAGLPVACSEIPPLREIAGEAALYFPPDDEDAMLDTLRRLLAGERAAEDGRGHARRYSWEAAARATLDVLTEAAR